MAKAILNSKNDNEDTSGDGSNLAMVFVDASTLHLSAIFAYFLSRRDHREQPVSLLFTVFSTASIFCIEYFKAQSSDAISETGELRGWLSPPLINSGKSRPGKNQTVFLYLKMFSWTILVNYGAIEGDFSIFI